MTSSRRSLLRGSLVALLGAAVAMLPWSAASAQSLGETSVGLAPSDAAFYGASLRLGDTFEKFTNSKAFDKLRTLPSVKALTDEFSNQWNDPSSDFAQAKAVLDDPETQKSLAFLGDMVSHEWWSYGDMKHADLVELGAQVQLAMREAQFEMQMQEARGGQPDPMIIVNGLIKSLDQNRNKIVIPNSITGFKVADKDRAKDQLAKLDAALAAALQGNPTLAPAYGKQVVGGTEFMVLDLKGNMVPWQLVGFFVQGIDFASFNRVVGKLNSLELTLAVGLKDDHVLFLMGDSAKYLETLGTDDALLARKEFAPLRAKDGEKFTAITYVSEAYKKRIGDPGDALAAMQQAFEAMLPQLPLNDDLRAEITKDLGKVGEWVKAQEFAPGATLSFEYETARGYEGYAYDWSENKLLDGSKPLSLAAHVGGDPIGFAVMRSKYDPEDYDTMVTVLQKIYGYAETYMMGEFDDVERDQYQKVMKIVTPHLTKLNATTRDKLIPAMKDGQSAVVLDMKETSRQWSTEMPPAQKPLPLPEIAFVYGVSDAALLQEALGDYHGIMQSLMDELHEFSPDEIPEIKLPPAQKSAVTGGSLYQYPVPPQSGLDGQIAPSSGFGESVAVWGYVPEQMKRVLAEKPVEADGGPLADLDRNLAGAGRFDFAAFVDGVEPWVEYGVAQYFRSQAVSTDGELVPVQFEEPTMDEILEQVRTTAEVLKCFKTYSSVTYLEDGATVIHFDYHFEDLE